MCSVSTKRTSLMVWSHGMLDWLSSQYGGGDNHQVARRVFNQRGARMQARTAHREARRSGLVIWPSQIGGFLLNCPLAVMVRFPQNQTAVLLQPTG